ncbi:MAG: metallophosphoesterase [Clostridiales bacterium]|nr:metallophosphoesterase [Clostridiales bacterium]
MKILLISDTHGRLDNFRRILKSVGPMDWVLHMGDVTGDEELVKAEAGCPVEFVAGNCDRMSQEPWDRFLSLGGHGILMTHGHRYHVNYGLDELEEAAELWEADVVLYGHTHVPEITYRGDRVFVNPGSTTLPRQPGHHPSYVLMEIDNKGECHFTINYLPTT